MPHGRLHADLRQLRTLLAEPMTDADLIDRFVESRDLQFCRAHSIVNSYPILRLRIISSCESLPASDSFPVDYGTPHSKHARKETL